ncbi:MAG: S-layer homology domain-containing protein [Clostridia bacterium]|nr:S-layer homology domain-containing protein [Clostridia bacterium]
MKYIKIVFALTIIFSCLTAYAFDDTENHWAKEYITELQKDEIMSGDGNLFMPDNNISRAEFIVATVRTLGADIKATGRSRFSDVDKNSFYAPYIIRAAELGIVLGYDDGTFRPDSYLTREEAVMVLSRAFGFLSGYNVSQEFSDADTIADVAKSAFAYALRKGVINGFPDKTLRPKSTLTRAEAAVLICGARKLETTAPGFVMGYPRLEKKGNYGTIRLEVCTNMPCNIYYMVQSKSVMGNPSELNINKLLTVITSANRQQVADIAADIGKGYNIYLMAVTPEGKKSNIVKLENITPLPYKDGDGTEKNPYGIYTSSHLDAVRYFQDKAFVLKNDISLSGEWEPIENFYGSLDGAGYKIDGLVINTDDSCVGLFKRVTRGKIKNLTVDGQITARANAGIIAGEFLNADISFCTVSGKVGVVTNNAGGFFGESAGRIENCLSGVYIVEAGSFAGGIAGQNYGIIKNSLSAAYTVVADIYAGGIASVNDGGRIENSVAACIHVYDMLLGNCGRITTNRKDSTIRNNYAYSGMITTSESGINLSDNGNGADILWDELINRDRLLELLGWEKSHWTGGGRSEVYLLPRPALTKEPEFLAGITEYVPVRISTSVELLAMIDNPDMHYLLVDNLYFNSNIKWRVAADAVFEDEGFSGTLDGGGKTIYNLTVTAGDSGNCGLFGIIYNGTVRNLNLNNPKYTSGEIIGSIAAVNYGTIENCSVNGFEIKVTGEGAYAGGMVGYNYGTLRSSDASGNIESETKNLVAGGICAHNEGFIDDTVYTGKIRTSKLGGVSESVVGGICGYNAGGMIYNAYSSADIRQQATTIYSGGICAIQSDGEIYKCSSRGNVIAEQPGIAIAVAYSGGISGLAAGGIVMHTFSTCDIKQYTLKSYLGGICGYNEAAIIQNGYAAGSLLQTNDAEIKKEMISYAGGICGYNEYGTISSTFAVNPSISSYGVVARICPAGAKEQMFGNYAVEMDINSNGEGAFGGTTISEKRLNTAFFVKPLFEGGLMGWSDEIWVKSNNYAFNLPVLSGVRNQGVFKR